MQHGLTGRSGDQQDRQTTGLTSNQDTGASTEALPLQKRIASIASRLETIVGHQFGILDTLRVVPVHPLVPGVPATDPTQRHLMHNLDEIESRLSQLERLCGEIGNRI